MRQNLQQGLLYGSTKFNILCPLYYLPILIGFTAGIGEAKIIHIVFFVAFRQGPLDSAVIGNTKVICFVRTYLK